MTTKRYPVYRYTSFDPVIAHVMFLAKAARVPDYLLSEKSGLATRTISKLRATALQRNIRSRQREVYFSTVQRLVTALGLSLLDIEKARREELKKTLRLVTGRRRAGG